MEKIGRNDLCPCGSGKKYKKCCGKTNVISMESLIEKELHEIQIDVLQFAFQNYQEEIDDCLAEWHEELVIPEEALEIFHLFACTWFITSVELDGKTIMAEYIDRHIHKINRPRIKDTLQSWRSARPSVSIIQDQDENQYVTVQDIFTNEVYKVKVLDEEHAVETGGLILGTILPTGATSVFFTTFIDRPAVESEELKEAVWSLYENSEEESPVDFVTESYLEVLNLFIFGKIDFSIDDLEWISAKHMEVAVAYQTYMEDYENDESIIHLGVYLWHQYCMRRNPKIMKSSVYVATLVYLINKLHPFGGEITQKELAEEFQISSSSLSSKYKDMEDVLSEEIVDLHNKLSEIDAEDLFEADFFDDEENN